MARWGVLLIGGVLVAGAYAPGATSADPAATAASKRGVTVVSARGYRYVSVTEPVSDNTQGGNEAICPGNEPVVGGGVYANAALPARLEVNTSRPYNADSDQRADDGWQAYVDNVNSGDPADSSFLVYAICDKKAEEKDYRYVVRGPAGAPEGAQTGLPATCPDDEPVLSGGSVSSGFLNDEMHVNTSRPYDGADAGSRLDDGWSTFIDNENAGNPNQIISAYAICDKAREPAAYVYKSKAETAPDDNQAGALSPCPGSSRLVGGGVGSSGFFVQRMYATGTFPDDTVGGPAPDAWAGRVNNVTGGGAFQSVTAYAVCRK